MTTLADSGFDSAMPAITMPEASAALQRICASASQNLEIKALIICPGLYLAMAAMA
jgi:hypothetical protein